MTSAVSTPFVAGSFKPLKKTNPVGSVGAVWSREVSLSTVMCEWPMMLPELSTVCGAAKKFWLGFVKKPVLRFLIAIWIVKSLLAGMVWPFLGKTNLDEGMFAVDAMTPIGAGLHEPVLICRPFVIALGTVAQKLMKLFVDVSDGTWFSAGLDG